MCWRGADCKHVLFNEKTHFLQRFASWLSTGEGKWAVALKHLIRLGSQNQRLTVYTVSAVTICLLHHDNYPANRAEPIMLKKVPTMLCCTAPKIFLLCSTNAPIMLKICSLNVTLIVKTNHLDCFKYAWVVCIFIISSC